MHEQITQASKAGQSRASSRTLWISTCMHRNDSRRKRKLVFFFCSGACIAGIGICHVCGKAKQTEVKWRAVTEQSGENIFLVKEGDDDPLMHVRFKCQRRREMVGEQKGKRKEGCVIAKLVGTRGRGPKWSLQNCINTTLNPLLLPPAVREKRSYIIHIISPDQKTLYTRSRKRRYKPPSLSLSSGKSREASVTRSSLQR